MTENWKKEMAHEPTKEYYKAMKEFINTDFVFELGKNNKWEVMEIGVRTGISTHAFLESEYVGHLTSIDKLECPMATLEVVDLNRMDDWSFHNMSSWDYFHSNLASGAKFDIVFVDGDHHEKPCMQDMQMAWGLLKEPGILLVDDVQHRKNWKGDFGMGVGRAFWGMMYSKKRIATFYPCQNGLAYIVK